jgi:hypothetical protein
MPPSIDWWLRQLSFMDPTGGIAVATAVVIASLVPQGVLAAWLARSPVPWRRIASKPAWTFITMGCLLAGQFLGFFAALWARDRLLDPVRYGLGRDILLATWAALAFPSTFVIARAKGRYAPPPVVTRFAAQLTDAIEPTPAAPFAGWKSRVLAVREEEGGAAIALRPYRIWEKLVVPLGMLVGVAVGASLLPDSGTGQARAVRSLAVYGTGMGFGVLAALLGFLLAGREETVTIAGGTVTIDRELLRWPRVRRRRFYPISRVSNLRAVEPPPMKTSGRYVRPVPPPWLLYLAFDHEGRTVRFGTGLVGPDADRVLRALARAMSAPTR